MPGGCPAEQNTYHVGGMRAGGSGGLTQSCKVQAAAWLHAAVTCGCAG